MNATIAQLKHHKSLIGLFAGVVAIACLLPDVVCAESGFVEQFKFSGGVVVAIDFDDGQSIADLATDGPFVIHALLSDEAQVTAAQQAIQEAGVYGKVSCDLYNGRDLPYVDGLVNLVLCKESCEVSQAELMRVLVPGGRLVVEGANGWKKRARPVPDGLDEWNQFLHGADNNGVSLDDVGPPQRLRWHDTPEYGRSKSLSPSFTNMVSADGVLLTIEDRATTEDINAPVEYYLVARDGFNGIELWKRPMKQWSGWQTGSIKSIPTQQQRCLAAVGNSVFVCSGFGGLVKAFAIRTGAVRQIYENTKRTTEFFIDGNALYVIKGTPYKLPRAAAADGRAELCAVRLKDGAVLWSHAIEDEYSGVNAFYNGSGNTDRRFTVEITPRLVKGPAFGNNEGEVTTAGDWPTYRYSNMRSGVAPGRTPEELATKWKVGVGNHPTAPVVAGDNVYVADRDGYTLYLLNRDNGRARWSFIADGRIDSPPTYYKGMILVGSRGGSVYGLRASDGQLAWKFNGMPQRRLICDTGRLESAWPVHGSIMIYDDTAYFAAGRSTFLDGGIAVFGLDPITGAMKHSRIMQGPYEDDTRSFPVQARGQFQLEGCKADILSCTGNELFMRNQAFKPDLAPIAPERVKTLHLLASPGFLNNSPQHRTYWTVDRDLRYGGARGKFGSGPAGDTIAFDGKLFYEIRGYAPGRNLPGRGRDLSQLELYSVYSGSYGGMGEKEDSSAIPAMGRWQQRWKTPTPFAGHAIVAAENTVMAAGVPMLKGYTVEDTNAAYAGKKGGIAWLLDAQDGRQLQELHFDAAPVWDGIAIAHGSYFVCLKNGSVVCLSGR